MNGADIDAKLAESGLKIFRRKEPYKPGWFLTEVALQVHHEGRPNPAAVAPTQDGADELVIKTLIARRDECQLAIDWLRKEAR